MTIKELILAEIDKIPEDKLDEFYQLTKEFIKKNYSNNQETVSINRSLLNKQYEIISQKITQQFDSEWLKTLETEDDLLQIAIELNKSYSKKESKKGILSKLKEIKIQAPTDYSVNFHKYSYQQEANDQ